MENEIKLQMTDKEANDYIKWHGNKVDEYHYLAHFKSSRPLIIENPESYDKLREAKIQLGIFQWQRSYEELKRLHKGLTLEKYNSYREKYNLNK
jgi:hypothetical protein